MRHIAAFGILLLCASDVSSQLSNTQICRLEGSSSIDQCPSNGPRCPREAFECNTLKVGASCGEGRSCQKVCGFLDPKSACCVCSLITQPQALSCVVQPVGPNNIEVAVQAPDDGLDSIAISVVRNLTVSVPDFQEGTLDPVIVSGSKVDPNLSARLDLQVCTSTSYCALCDPVITLVARDPGKPELETFSGLPDAEHYVKIKNGAPGLKNLLVVVNGAFFRVPGLADNEEHALDVSSAMQPGDDNVLQLQAFGKPGASATVVIHD